MTKNEVIEKYPFASIDSSSWKAGVRFGMGLVPDDTGMRYCRYRDIESVRRLRTVHDIAEMNSETTKAQYYARLRQSVLAFKAMQDRATRLWRMRGVDWEVRGL